jgi:hypothetical protein
MVNIDLRKEVKPDIVCDINKRISLDDESVDYIKAYDILEHLGASGIDETYRILKFGGVLKVRVPHYASRNAYNDFTHLHFFNSNTFKNSIFKKFDLERQDVWYSFANHRVSFRLPNRLVAIHERLFPGFLPPSHIIAVLKKNKKS